RGQPGEHLQRRDAFRIHTALGEEARVRRHVAHHAAKQAEHALRDILLAHAPKERRNVGRREILERLDPARAALPNGSHVPRFHIMAAGRPSSGVSRACKPLDATLLRAPNGSSLYSLTKLATK